MRNVLRVLSAPWPQVRQSGFCGGTGFTSAARGEGGSGGDNVEPFGTVTAVLQFGQGGCDADLGGRRGDMLATRRTFKLEFHRRVDVIMAGSFAIWQ